MKRLLAVCTFLLTITFAAMATPFNVCPAVGNDTLGCELLVTVTAVDGSGAATAFTVTTNPTDQGPFDGSEDTLIGVTNLALGTLKSIAISGAGGAAIFGFDGDGACSGSYSPGPTASQCFGGVFTTTDPNDYESAGATFSGINAGLTAGTVNVNLANGASTWFDLEGQITSTTIVNGTPEPGSVMLFGTGLAGLLGLVGLRRRTQA